MADVREHTNRQPFREHVAELRRAITFSLLYVLIGSAIGYALYKPIFAILIKPYNNQLYYTTPAGAFNAIFKVSILFGLIIAIPFIVHRIFKFISPAFPKRIQFFTAKLIVMSGIFALAGISFGYFVSLPSTLHFLTTVGPDNIKALINVSDYLNFVFHYLLGLAIVFQFPLILLIINKITPLKSGGLMRYQRHVIAGSTVVAAVITPTTDPINMTLMTVPMIVLYQVGVIFVWYANRNRVSINYVKRPANVEPVVINPIPEGFALASNTPFAIAQPEPVQAVVERQPSSQRAVVIQSFDTPSSIEVKVAKPRILPSLQNYVPRRIVMDILPPTASA